MNDEGITQLLTSWSSGDQGAAERLLPLVYEELRRIASRQLRRERESHTLQATAIVHKPAAARSSEIQGIAAAATAGSGG